MVDLYEKDHQHHQKNINHHLNQIPPHFNLNFNFMISITIKISLHHHHTNHKNRYIFENASLLVILGVSFIFFMEFKVVF